MTGSHTCERIAEELRVTQQKWSLPQPIVTTNNAANEQKAYQILVYDRYGCYVHRINLVVKKLLDIHCWKGQKACDLLPSVHKHKRPSSRKTATSV